MQLVIGNKNYSSWSMRPWVLLRHFEIPFEEIRIALFRAGYKEVLARYSPSLRVPVLIDAGHTIWDSLAICEFVAENFLQGQAYPEDRFLRARCRSYCNEMHAGFLAIRNQLPMNIRARRRLDYGPELLAEVRRVEAIWSEARTHYGASGDYLFGDFSIADCMYAPVATRFRTYGVGLAPTAQTYLEALLDNAAVKQWCAEAAAETEILADHEVGEEQVG